MDTLSGICWKHPFCAGIASRVSTCLAGIITTPAWYDPPSYPGVVYGAMISASHNPMQDNVISSSPMRHKTGRRPGTGSVRNYTATL